MVFRPESALVYFDVDNVCDVILNRVRAAPKVPKLVVLDLSAAPLVDMQSAHTLAGMAMNSPLKVFGFKQWNLVRRCATGSATKASMANWAASTGLQQWPM
jgi:MFS superfamily sulfate permease-like transporter